MTVTITITRAMLEALLEQTFGKCTGRAEWPSTPGNGGSSHAQAAHTCP
jgi:hypothetical protein